MEKKGKNTAEVRTLTNDSPAGFLALLPRERGLLYHDNFSREKLERQQSFFERAVGIVPFGWSDPAHCKGVSYALDPAVDRYHALTGPIPNHSSRRKSMRKAEAAEAEIWTKTLIAPASGPDVSAKGRQEMSQSCHDWPY